MAYCNGKYKICDNMVVKMFDAPYTAKYLFGALTTYDDAEVSCNRKV